MRAKLISFLGMQFTTATDSDIEYIHNLDQQIFGSYGADEDVGIITKRVQTFPEGCLIIKHRDGNTQYNVGYITSEKWKEMKEPVLNEDPEKSHHPDGKILNITTLAIETKYQKKGFGSKTLQFITKLCKDQNCEQIVLETAKARKFYEDNGFSLLELRKQRDIPLYIMTKRV